MGRDKTGFLGLLVYAPVLDSAGGYSLFIWGKCIGCTCAIDVLSRVCNTSIKSCF